MCGGIVGALTLGVSKDEKKPLLLLSALATTSGVFLAIL